MDTSYESVSDQAEGFLHPTMEQFIQWLEWTLNQDLHIASELEPEQLADLKEVYWDDFMNDLMFSYQAKREQEVY